MRLGYALDEIEFEETFVLPAPIADSPAIEGLLDLLHWVAGVSYYKAAIPEHLVCETGAPPPATARLLSTLYSEGLGEFAVVNGLERLPRPQFPRGIEPSRAPARATLERILVSGRRRQGQLVAIEIARASGLEAALFSVGDATPIHETASVAGLPRHIVTRTIDPLLLELNDQGALNGHVPITAIVSCVALLTAATQGYRRGADRERALASAGNLVFDGIEVNHQFSKSRRAERLLADAVAEIEGAPQIFSILRPASELAHRSGFREARAVPLRVHQLQSCLQLDPDERLGSWCCDCDKCRFVFLILAPFMPPEQAHRDLRQGPSRRPGSVRRLRAADRAPAATSRSSAWARSRSASRRSACSPSTRSGASTQSSRGSSTRCSTARDLSDDEIAATSR